MSTGTVTLRPIYAQDAPLTVEDWLDQPEDWPRNELYQGMIVVTPPPNVSHQTLTALIHHALMSFALPRGGFALGAPTAVELAPDIGFEPDVVHLSAERMDRLGERAVRGAPDLVVEVLSPSTQTYDLDTKLPTYLAHGVNEGWIVDPLRETVTLHWPEAGARPVSLTFGAEIPSRIVPGIGKALLDQRPPLPQ